MDATVSTALATAANLKRAAERLDALQADRDRVATRLADLDADIATCQAELDAHLQEWCGQASAVDTRAIGVSIGVAKVA